MEYSKADFFNNLFRDSENKGYNANYTRVNNNSYGGNNKSGKSTSNAKVITYLVVGGILVFYTYKNVLKPAAKVVGNILNLFETDDEKPSMRNWANNGSSDHVLDGQITRLSPKEARKLQRGNDTYLAYEDPFKPGSYKIVEE